MKVLKSVSTYTLGSILTLGIPFFILPILTQYLSPEDYGILRLFSAYVTILVPFITLVSYGLSSIEYFKQNESEFASLFTSFIRVPFYNAFLYGLIIFFFKEPLSSLTGIPPNWLLLIPFLGLCIALTDLCLSMMTQQKRPVEFIKFSVGRTIFETGTTVYFVIILGMNWQGRIASLLAATALFSVISLFYFHRQGWLGGRYSKSWMKQSLIFGIPLIPHSISNFVINQSDIIFVSKLVSLEATGLYGVGYQFGLVVSIASGAFLKYLGPYISERLAQVTEEKKVEIVKMSYYYIGFLALAAIVTIVGSHIFFTHFLDERYWPGLDYVGWIALAYFFWGTYSVFARYIFFFKRTKVLTYLSVINISLNLILNYLLIIEFGAMGAAYATTISFAVVLTGVIIAARGIYPMPWFYFLKSRTSHRDL